MSPWETTFWKGAGVGYRLRVDVSAAIQVEHAARNTAL